MKQYQAYTRKTPVSSQSPSCLFLVWVCFLQPRAPKRFRSCRWVTPSPTGRPGVPTIRVIGVLCSLQLTGAGYAVEFVGSQTSGTPLDFDRDHEGHSGWRADQIRDNVYNWLETNPAEIVLLHIGTNDVSGSNQDVQEVEDILVNIDQYETDNSVSVKVMLARIILRNDSRNPQTIALNHAVEAMALLRIAGGDDIVLVDQENALTYPGDLADTVHPNDTGYGKMADVWFAALDPVLSSVTYPSVSGVALACNVARSADHRRSDLLLHPDRRCNRGRYGVDQERVTPDDALHAV